MTSDTAVPAEVKRRIPLWDTARFVAIALVVAGHAIQPMQDASPLASVVYLSIYTFHIPLFVLISGYFAKDVLDARGLRRIITDLAIPYLIFETIWSVVHWIERGVWPPDYTHAWWTLWFLLALIAWRLLLPLLAATRWPLAAAVGISVLAGYSGNIDATFSMARMLGLLPFFVLGWRLRSVRVGGADLSAWWTDLSRRSVARARIGAVLLVAIVVAAIAAALPFWREMHLSDFLFYDSAYPTIGDDQWWAGGIRLAVMVVGAALSVAVLALIPRRTVAVTALGSATLYVYLLHTAVLYPLRKARFLADTASGLTLAIVLVASIALTLALSSKPIRTVFRPLVEPRMAWLLARDRP